MEKNLTVIPIFGVIFQNENMASQLIQGLTLDVFANDFRNALQKPIFSVIILSINSPGGTVSGVNEVAEIIYAARGKKPIIAYVSGICASAAYNCFCLR